MDGGLEDGQSRALVTHGHDTFLRWWGNISIDGGWRPNKCAGTKRAPGMKRRKGRKDDHSDNKWT